MSHLECGICLQIMEQPTTLPCGHSFCRDRCLLPSKKHNSTCPQCREEIPSMCHRVNITLRDIIDASSQHSPEQESCYQCEEAPATLFCPDCDRPFCQECSSFIHKIKHLRSHTIVPLSQRSSVSLPKCPHHKGKQLDHYCTKCKVALCDSCGLVDGHSLHPECLVPFAKAKEILSQQSNQLQESLATTTLPLVEAGDNVSNVVKETIEGTQSVIHDLIGDLIQQSQSKIQQIDSCSSVAESIKFDGNAQVQAEKQISNAINSLQEFKRILTDCFQDVKTNIYFYQINFLRELLREDFDDVTKLNISKRAQIGLINVQIDPEYLLSTEQLSETLPLNIDQDIKQKLVNNFVNNSTSISSNDFAQLLNVQPNLFSDNEFQSLLWKIQFNALNSNQFKILINSAIKYSTSWLLGKAIDHYEFGSNPEVFTISSDLLLDLNLSNSINKNKEEWLEGVIVGNCSFDIINQLCQKLLGRETKFMKFNTNQSGSRMVFSEGNRRVLNDCCSNWKHCNFAAMDFNPNKFKIAIQRTRKVGDNELIGFWTMDGIRKGTVEVLSGGTCYGTGGDRGNFSLPLMHQGDILYVNIENNQATFSLNGSSDTKPIPAGTVFGLLVRHKGSEYSIVDY
ncbi:hypothetical protein P9112_005222 [Eukaryota sp. TZLM1-RC]